MRGVRVVFGPGRFGQFGGALTKSGAATLVNLACVAAVAKVLSVVLGPAGLGLFGILRQLSVSLTQIASLGGFHVVIRTGSARQGEERQQYFRQTLILALLFISTTTTVSLAICIAVLPDIVGAASVQPRMMILIAVLAVPAYAVAAFLNATTIACGRVGLAALAQSVASIGMVLVTYPLAQSYALGNELSLPLVLVIASIISLVSALVAAYFNDDGRSALIRSLPRIRDAIAEGKEFFSFSFVILAAACIQFVLAFFLRATILSAKGIEAVGYFEAAWGFSVLYVSTLTAGLGTYYFPRMSQTQDAKSTGRFFDDAIAILSVLAVTVILLLTALKAVLIELLFSREFFPALELISLFLICDIFRITGMAYAYLLLAKRRTKAYLWSELLLATFLGWLGYRAIHSGGLGELGIIYVIGYVGYVVGMTWYCRSNLSLAVSGSTLKMWLIALISILAGSMINYDWTTPVASRLVLTVALLAIAGMLMRYVRKDWIGISP